MVAINKAPNTHNKSRPGAEENTSGENVTPKLHEQTSWETNAARFGKEKLFLGGERTKKRSGHGLSFSATVSQ